MKSPFLHLFFLFYIFSYSQQEYFVSLTGFVASWIAGEVYKPQDQIKKVQGS